jgi:hypothetical protein
MRRAGIMVLAMLALAPTSIGRAQARLGDLDTFMEQVLARRDDNWKKLKLYVLDEKERAELRGPAESLVWGQQPEARSGSTVWPSARAGARKRKTIF